MNRKRTFVILGVIVLLFLGIFTFAQESNEKDPKKNDSDGSGQVIDDPTKIDEEKPEEIISNVIPRRTAITPDTIAPVIALNGEDTIYIDINSNYEEKGAVVTDNRDSNILATISGIVNTSKAGKYTLTYSGIDAAGNVAIEVIRTIYVRPLITATSTLDTYEAGDSILPVITATVLYDNEVGEQSINPDVAFDPTLLGTQTLKFNYNYEGVDAEEKTLTILVQDTTAPTIQLHGDGNITLNLGENFVDIEPAITYSDNYDTNEQLTLTMSYTFKALGSSSYTEASEIDTTKAGQYYKYYTVTDGNGNSNYVSRGITVVDSMVPTIQLHGSGNVTLNLGETFIDIDPAITYSDNYDTNEQLTLTISYMFKALGSSSYTEVSEIDTTKAGQYYKYYTVTDRSGKANFVSRGITVVDSIDPEVRLIGSGNVTLNLGESFVDIDPAITYSDNYDTNEQLTLTTSYTFKALGSLSYTEVSEIDTTKAGQYYKYYTVTDRSGNDYYVTRGITVLDNIPPLGEITYNNVALTNQDVIATLTVNEPIQTLAGWNKTSNLIWTKPVESNTTQTIEFYDLAGNKGTASLSVGNIDKEKPVITFSGNNPLSLGCITNFDFKTSASATDNHDGNITSRMTYTHNFIYGEINIPFIGNIKGILPGNYSITYTVTDSAGNSTTSTRNVIVKLIAW